jgi:class 3 adenylate cyclase
MNVDLEKIKNEFMSFAPSYVKGPASIAIGNLIDLTQKKIITDGLYYVVLVDLVGSTKYGTEKGNKALSKRIETFVSSSVLALSSIELRSKALFIKEVGDAVLFIFHHFPDILNWNRNFRGYLKISIQDEEPFIIRTVIHTGEVFLKGVNPIALAVSQTFKIEKDIPDNSIGLTESAFLSAYPTLSRAYHAFEKHKSISVPGFNEKVMLYLLKFEDEKDLDNIIKEDHEYS